MKQMFLRALDGYELNLHIYEVENPKGFVQVVHGMEEYQDRYEYLAGKLNEAGYSVVTSNMRGHGEDAKMLGFFSEKDGDKYLVDDQLKITEYIKETYNVDKVILFAHSMGTIISRNVLMKGSNNYSKVILSGYPNPIPIAGLGAFFAKVSILFHGPKYFSKFLENLAVGGFNKAVKEPKTDFDWLSYNEENVKKYIECEYCGQGFKNSALWALFTLVANMGKAKNYINVNNMPMLLISGEDDPCTGGEKGRTASIKVLNDAGFNDIKVITYNHMRHEILNEDEKDVVTSNIVEFLK